MQLMTLEEHAHPSPKSVIFVGGPHDGVSLTIPQAPLPTMYMPGQNDEQALDEAGWFARERRLNRHWRYRYELSLDGGEPHYVFVGETR